MVGPKDATEVTLRDVAAGDVLSAAALSPELIEEAVTRGLTPPLSITSSSIERVLHSLLDGDVTSSEAQRWASFVRRGYLAVQGGCPVRPIPIEYENDDQIVDVVSRLDELGDQVDGEISPDELRDLLAGLRI